LGTDAVLLGGTIASSGLVVSVTGEVVTLSGLNYATSGALTVENAGAAQRTINLNQALTIASGSSLTITVPASPTATAIVGRSTTYVAFGLNDAEYTVTVNSGNSAQLTFENVKFGDEATLTLNAANVEDSLIQTAFTFGSSANATSGKFTNVTFAEDVVFNQGSRNGVANNSLKFSKDVTITNTSIVLSAAAINGDLILDGNNVTVLGTASIGGGIQFIGDTKIILGGSNLTLGNLSVVTSTSPSAVQVTENSTLTAVNVTTDVAISVEDTKSLTIIDMIIVASNEVVITLVGSGSELLLADINPDFDGLYEAGSPGDLVTLSSVNAVINVVSEAGITFTKSE
jgi:hypothetical protein